MTVKRGKFAPGQTVLIASVARHFAGQTGTVRTHLHHVNFDTNTSAWVYSVELPDTRRTLVVEELLSGVTQ